MNITYPLFAVGLLTSACAADLAGADPESASDVTVREEPLCTGNLCNDQHDQPIGDAVVLDGQFSGNGSCYAYRDADFRGASQRLDENWTYTNVGSAFNDQISSFRVAEAGCHVLAWIDINRGGTRAWYWADTPNVGSEFNDRISSWSCVCDGQ